MTYTPGVAWNVSYIDGKVITWVSDGDLQAVASVMDPESDLPARRVLADGAKVLLDGENVGLTVYGRSAMDRPSFSAFRELAPEHTGLVDGIEQRRGITQDRVTVDNPYLTAAEVADALGVSTATVYSYKAKGLMPAPDDYVGRTPRWTATTIGAWKRPGRGTGGGRPRKTAASE